ncbi:MAG: ATP-dependent zinc metalloprotease FtsH [Bacteroidota bacterium]|nr:ATP-dependent zinc metalloprotease FtsH [Bacteroidota bacterium]
MDENNLNSQPGKKKKFNFNFYWIYGIIAVIFIAMQIFNWNPVGSGINKEITQQKFENEILPTGKVDKILIINKETVQVYLKREKQKTRGNRPQIKASQDSTSGYYTFKIGSIENFRLDFKDAVARIIANDTTGMKMSSAQKQETIDKYRINILYETQKDWGSDILGWLLPIILLVIIWFIMFRKVGGPGGGGQIFNFGKSKAILFDKESSVQVNFNDVAGLEEAKVEIMEIVDFLKNPQKYTALGGKIPKGALLVGPPGTGKTLLAKAVAGEAHVPFFSISGSDFVEMFVGVGASRVRDLFKQAKDKAPCIIFIDEIDAIGRARGKNPMQSANDERESTLNQLLTEMDGFGSNSGVIILAATNRADILDRALLRAGRFDRQIQVELPDIEERKAIFRVHTKPLKINSSVEIDFLAKQTPGFSGADIANVCNEAALIAARGNKSEIDKQDFLDAVDRIIGGLEKRNKIISQEEKEVIAFHEAGHATVSWLLQYASPLVKVTIVPRGKALGAAWYLPEERQILRTEQMYDELCAALGGRASEEVVFGKISTGALNDLEKVTKQAYAMISIYGMNDKIGNISFYDSSGQSEYSLTKPYSEKTAEIIDDEVNKLVTGAYNKVKELLQKNMDSLKKLAEVLLTREVIFKDDLEEIFGPRPFEKPKKFEFNSPLNLEPGNDSNEQDKPLLT